MSKTANSVTDDWVSTFEKPENQNGFMWRMAADRVLPECVDPNDERVIALCQKASRENGPSFVDVVKPVMEWLAKNHHPHAKIIIEATGAELVEGLESFQSVEFIVD